MDDSPLLFTRWAITGHDSIPHAQYDCEYGNVNISCITLPIESVVHDALGVIQPHTANNTRLCAAIAMDRDFPWIMIPCGELLTSVLQICETSIDNAKDNDGNGTSPHWAKENELDMMRINSDYEYFIHGSMFIYRNFRHMINNSTCGEHCYSPSQTITPYCEQGWIFSHGVCFRLFHGYAANPGKASSAFKACFSDDSIINIHLSVITNSSIFDYISDWSIPEIYLLDEIGEDGVHHKCRYFKMSDAHNELYKIDLRKLSAAIKHDIRCGPENIDHLLCFREPIVPTGSCPEGTMRCNDQSCISSSYRCDARYDCPDHSDELNCDSICSLDNQTDCFNHCHGTKCTCGELYFKCVIGDCIHISLVSCIHISLVSCIHIS